MTYRVLELDSDTRSVMMRIQVASVHVDRPVVNSSPPPSGHHDRVPVGLVNEATHDGVNLFRDVISIASQLRSWVSETPVARSPKLDLDSREATGKEGSRPERSKEDIKKNGS